MNGETILFLSVGAVAVAIDMLAADIMASLKVTFYLDAVRMVSNVLYMGVALIRPNLTVLVDSTIAVAWLFVQVRLEEIHLIQRPPAYPDYMREMPRFTPRLRPVRTAHPPNEKSADR